ncbi:hypothetical protein [Arcobacter sp. LA11]|uniref:hypothetical protein n=1 Tax=Arcobacter sp. LA11 TaxID=1898176 RepID=UPI0009FB6C64|nr:hypothetical protein [Arcobacter sp. LA11]
MKKLLFTVLALFAINNFGFAKDELPKTTDPAAQAKADQQLKLQNKEIVKLVVEEIGKKLPQKVDDYTQFVSIKSEGLRLISTFEIDTAPKSDEAVIKNDKPRMEKFIKQGICQSSKRFLQSDINITYVYANALTKKELFRFAMTKDDCTNYWN